jgi:hypothetical protein
MEARVTASWREFFLREWEWLRREEKREDQREVAERSEVDLIGMKRW